MLTKRLRQPVLAGAVLLAACGGHKDHDDALDPELVAEGQQIFRFDTFGDEAKWTDTLRMHEVIAKSVDPATALSVGLKVDAEALPPAVLAGIKNGSADLKSPQTTVTLLKLNAVVGLVGKVETVNGKDVLKRVGITCARPARVPVVVAGAAAARQLQPGRSRARPGAVLRKRPVHHLPQRTEIYRRKRAPACGGGNGGRAGAGFAAQLCRAQRHQKIPYLTATRRVAAPALPAQREGGNAGGCGVDL